MNKAADVAVAIVVVAGILVMTRPGSMGAALIDAIGGAFSGALGVATGQQVTTAGVRSRGYGTRRVTRARSPRVRQTRRTIRQAA